ncbi:AbfB domain-containing protein [Nonomuraea sp. JJY05]|uniref:AbfB domain-containing protein n=1 Tax=Nonomuraea sp. JJY05 TaxID=3350255 RepID=UPI00373F758D
MSLSRRQFGKAALASAALTTTGVVGSPRAAWAANTAYVFAYFTESPNQSAADYGLHLAVSRDGLNWTPLNQDNPVVTPTAGITDAEYNGLVSRWGLPNWVRLKSYNLPDYFVRHANRVGRIDPYPFDPYREQLWRMVPGPADSAGVSFESVSVPGNYLRHSNCTIRLDPDDGSSAFRADATFHRVAGLADGGWSSFRSCNFPTHHLRRQGYALRIDPITSSSSVADRQDATFRVTS